MKEKRQKGVRGRPKGAPENIRRSVSVRFSMAELADIQRKADASGLRPTTWIRQAALSRQPIRAVVPALNREAYSELARLAGNINQLTRAAHEGRVPYSPTQFEQLQRKIQELRLDLLGVNRDRQND